MAVPFDDFDPPPTDEQKKAAIKKIEEEGAEFARLIRRTDTTTLGYKDPSAHARRAIEKVEEAIMWARRAFLDYGKY